jgi:hypothetical protein
VIDASVLSPAQEAELADLSAWLLTAPLPYGPYRVGPAVTVNDNIRSHAYLRNAIARKVLGQQRRALLDRLRRLRLMFGEPPPLAVPPGSRLRVEVFP